MSCREEGNQMPEKDGVKQNRLRNKELVLGKPGVRIEIFKQMNCFHKYQRDTALLTTLYKQRLLSVPCSCPKPTWYNYLLEKRIWGSWKLLISCCESEQELISGISCTTCAPGQMTSHCRQHCWLFGLDMPQDSSYSNRSLSAIPNDLFSRTERDFRHSSYLLVAWGTVAPATISSVGCTVKDTYRGYTTWRQQRSFFMTPFTGTGL